MIDRNRAIWNRLSEYRNHFPAGVGRESAGTRIKVQLESAAHREVGQRNSAKGCAGSFAAQLAG